MCGFLCVFDENATLSARKSDVIRAGERLSHRGPDDHGLYCDDYFAAYVRRLSILDPSAAGHQPMVSDDGRFVIAFNGEIYNYKQLRDFLEGRGHRLVSHCDTEVVLRLYRELGDGCVERLRGMFAFAIWKPREKQLVLVRDRLGIKPLYIWQENGQTVVASEIKAILSFNPRAGELDERSIFKYLARGWVDDSVDTFYAGIKAVPHASVMQVSGRKTSSRKYWSLAAGAGRPFNVAEFQEKFFDAVRGHLQADVPVAALLSGGMDTSSVVAAAATVSELPLAAFSATLSRAAVTDGGARGYKVGADETPWIDETVRETDVRHAYLNYGSDDFAEAVDACLKAHDEPFQESDCVYSFLAQRDVARHGFKVLLVGEGGDEVLAGYARLFLPYLLSLRNEGRDAEYSAALAGAQQWLDQPASVIVDRLDTYARLLRSGGSGQENMSAYPLLDDDFTAAHEDVVSEPAYPTSVGTCGNYFFAHLGKHIFERDLPYHLRLTDRNAMAHGIEARPPLLDHEFVELVFSYDYGAFMKDGVNKAMLRTAMRPYLPAAVVDRQGKEGRPGNPAQIVYGSLWSELNTMLAPDALPSFLSRDCQALLRQDRADDNAERAMVWFRSYVLLRWLSVQ